jgi:hypothetical protein
MLPRFTGGVRLDVLSVKVAGPVPDQVSSVDWFAPKIVVVELQANGVGAGAGAIVVVLVVVAVGSVEFKAAVVLTGASFSTLLGEIVSAP